MKDSEMCPTYLKMDVWFTPTSRRFPSWCQCRTEDIANTIGSGFLRRRCKGDSKNWDDTHPRWCIEFNRDNSSFTILTWCQTKKVSMCPAVTLSQAEPYLMRCTGACFTPRRTPTMTVTKYVKDVTTDVKGFVCSSSAQITTVLDKARNIFLSRLPRVSTTAVIWASRMRPIKATS